MTFVQLARSSVGTLLSHRKRQRYHAGAVWVLSIWNLLVGLALLFSAITGLNADLYSEFGSLWLYAAMTISSAAVLPPLYGAWLESRGCWTGYLAWLICVWYGAIFSFNSAAFTLKLGFTTGTSSYLAGMLLAVEVASGLPSPLHDLWTRVKTLRR